MAAGRSSSGVAGVLGLQRAAGNKATVLAVQRRFDAYSVTAKTHLRKGTAGAKKVTTMRWGWTGDALHTGDRLIVDPDEHKGGWARATKTPFDSWNGQPPDTTFVRTSKVKAVAGPVVGDQWFHPRLGLCRIVSGHVGIVTGAILKSSSSQSFVKVLGGGQETEDAAQLTLAEHRMLGDLVDKEATADDGQAIYGVRSKQGYFKTNGETNPLVQFTPSTAEKLRLFEVSQKQAVTERRKLAEDLGDADKPTTTVTVAYQAKGMGGAVNVKITGKPGSAFYDRQKTAIQKALATLKEHKVPIADGLELVISSTLDPRLKNEAFHTGAGVIFLRANIFDHKPTTAEANPEDIRGGVPTAGILGVTHQLAIQEGVDDAEEQIAVGTIIHEIGHVIHRTADPATFDKYRMGLDQVEERTGEQVTREELTKLSVLTKKISHYASNAGYGNVTELVAEVFTGVTNGLKYPAEVIAAYLKYGGVKTWDNDDDVTEG
jgi:hypothetical protein